MTLDLCGVWLVQHIMSFANVILITMCVFVSLELGF